jgi:hypothetical protein
MNVYFTAIRAVACHEMTQQQDQQSFIIFIPNSAQCRFAVMLILVRSHNFCLLSPHDPAISIALSPTSDIHLRHKSKHNRILRR